MTDIAQWQQRLKETFGQGGPIGRNLERLNERQAEYGLWIATTYHGFMSLSEAFLSFHFDLPDLLNEYVLGPMTRGPERASAAYGITVVRHVTDFRVLHAARKLLFDGCPHEGTALMRSVFDAALIRSAIVQGFTTVEAVEGVANQTPGTPFNYEVVKRKRIREEKRVDRIMVGEDSGLSPDTIEELKKWEELLHMELHGGRLSQASALGWLRGQEPLSITPTPKEKDAAMLFNRWVEIAWMVHRLMPTLQFQGLRFPSEWQSKWQVLDESFVPMVTSLSTQLGKKIGDAMFEFVTRKFPFTATSVSTV
jgi:hypothetical protein